MADPVTSFRLHPVDTRVGEVALVTIDNGADWQKPSTFGREALESLETLLDTVESREWAGLLLTGKPFVFAAGADVNAFPGITAELARAAGRAGHELFGRLRALPFPTLAALNGVAVGGGLEIALHCDLRTISSAVRHVAFPEVFLGLIPGWGGTQLAPRLLGAERAVELIVDNPLRQNRMLTGEQALALGLADHLLQPVEFLDESLEILVAAVERGGDARDDADLSNAAEVCARARARVDDQVHGAAPAPYRALDLIEGAARWTIDEGYLAEEDALAELLPGPEAQASVYAFDVVERRIKRGVGVPQAEPRRIGRIGIVGAGLMATQLATLFLRRLEVPVVISDVDEDRAATAVQEVGAALEKLVARGRLPEPKARWLAASVTAVPFPDGYATCDLVLEAVFEDLAVKQDVLSALEHVVPATTVLATNTSSLSVTAMADGLDHPERVTGLHFFNPVAVLPLVEVVRAASTDDASVATAWDVTQRLGKRGVLVRDAPGFVVNRMLTRQSCVLFTAVENGNTFEETDAAALRLGLPMPPSALLALVGPAVANHVRRTMHAAFPDRFPLSPTLENLARGEMDVVLTGDARRSADELYDELLEALADEAAHILRDRVCGSAAELDACMILGAGFPFFRGGITRYLDQTGVSERVTGTTLAALA